MIDDKEILRMAKLLDETVKLVGQLSKVTDLLSKSISDLQKRMDRVEDASREAGANSNLALYKLKKIELDGKY